MPRNCEKSSSNKVRKLLARLKEKEEKIRLVLECLGEESAKGKPIIVEGKRDIETLRMLGVKGKIISAKTGGKSLLDVIFEVENCGVHEVIVLLDFDRKGKEWTKRLKQHLERTKITLNLEFWNELLGLVGKEVKDIEGLAAYIATLKRKIS